MWAAGGYGGGGGGGSSGVWAGLVDRVKQWQRSSPAHKRSWENFCYTKGTDKFDPGRKEESFLQEFLDMADAGMVALEPAVEGADSAAKAPLVDRVKQWQRLGPSHRQAWWNFCLKQGSKDFDPNRHDALTLQTFVAGVDAGQIQPEEPTFDKGKGKGKEKRSDYGGGGGGYGGGGGGGGKGWGTPEVIKQQLDMAFDTASAMHGQGQAWSAGGSVGAEGGWDPSAYPPQVTGACGGELSGNVASWGAAGGAAADAGGGYGPSAGGNTHHGYSPY